MDLSALQHLAAGNTWCAIWPELTLGCLALALLALEIVLPKRAHGRIPAVAIAGQLVVLALLAMNFSGGGPERGIFNGLLRHSTAGQIMRVFFLISSVFACLLARVTLAKQTDAAGRVLRHRPDRHRGADAAGPKQPFCDAVCLPGDRHGRILHPGELFPAPAR